MRFSLVCGFCFLIAPVVDCPGEAPLAHPGRVEQPESASPADDLQGVDTEKLIDQLAEIAVQGFGYSISFSGSQFLPYEGTEQFSMMLLVRAQTARSLALREIVRRGVPAVPALLKHINDTRTTKMPAVAGMMWTMHSDEYDFNRRTRPTRPKGVNGDDGGIGKNHPQVHTITVGDVCFVALGQIVNRRFAATRYQPSGGAVISSPTYSEALRKVILEDWSTLTAESHKRLLIEDFLQPDSSDRQTGAYLRLAFYYPDTVEELVLKELSRPTFDAFIVEDFCRSTLYMIEDVNERKLAYDWFLRKFRPAFADGILLQLFDDVDSTFIDQSRPRELLIQLYDQPVDVKPTDRPFVNSVEECDQSRLIGSLIHDNSQKIGDVVKARLLTDPSNEYCNSHYLRCLASRGYVDLLVEQLAKIDPTVSVSNNPHT